MVLQRHPVVSGCRNGMFELAMTLMEDPAASSQPDEDKAARMRLLEVTVYLDVALVGNTLDEVCTAAGCVGCSIMVVVLLFYEYPKPVSDYATTCFRVHTPELVSPCLVQGWASFTMYPQHDQEQTIVDLLRRSKDFEVRSVLAPHVLCPRQCSRILWLQGRTWKLVQNQSPPIPVLPACLAFATLPPVQNHELGKRLAAWHTQKRRLQDNLAAKQVDDLNHNTVDGAPPCSRCICPRGKPPAITCSMSSELHTSADEIRQAINQSKCVLLCPMQRCRAAHCRRWLHCRCLRACLHLQVCSSESSSRS